MARPPILAAWSREDKLHASKTGARCGLGHPGVTILSSLQGWGLEGRRSFSSDLGTQGARLGLVTQEMQASESSDTHRLKSSRKEGAASSPKSLVLVHRGCQVAWAGGGQEREKAPEEMSHLPACSCIWGSNCTRQPVVGACGSGGPPSVC